MSKRRKCVVAIENSQCVLKSFNSALSEETIKSIKDNVSSLFHGDCIMSGAVKKIDGKDVYIIDDFATRTPMSYEDRWKLLSGAIQGEHPVIKVRSLNQ